MAAVLAPGSHRYAAWLSEAGASVSWVSGVAEACRLEASSSWAFHAAVVDAVLPDGCGISLAEALSVRRPHCRLIIVAPSVDADVMTRVCAIPGATLLSDRTTNVELLFAVRDNAISAPLALRQLAKQVSEDLRLSHQQERILWLNLWGYADQEIAEILAIQPHTVHDYQAALRRKTGVRSKAGYLRLLLEHQGARPSR